MNKTGTFARYEDTDPHALIPVISEELQLPHRGALILRHDRGEDVWLMLCALLAPNLEHVRTSVRKQSSPIVSSPQSSSILLLLYIGESALGTPIGDVHTFDNLRTIHVDSGIETSFTIADACSLLLLPRLNRLSLVGWGALYEDQEYICDQDSSTFYGKPWVWPVRSSNVTEVSFEFPFADVRRMCRMIRACKGLVKFECVTGAPPLLV